MNFIYLWPTWLIIVFEVIVFTAPAVIGHMLFRHYWPQDRPAKENDIIGFVLALVGPIYAVLLAFVVVIAWESFNAAEGIARTEVFAAGDLDRLSRDYSGPPALELRQEIEHYADLMRSDEWPAMQSGAESPRARDSAARIGDLAVLMIQGQARGRTAVDDSVMDLVRSFADARRERLEQNNEGIPSALWVGLAIGAVMIIVISYLFGVEDSRLHLLLTGTLAAVVGLMFAMIVSLDYPYRGDTSISPDIWRLPSYLAVPAGAQRSAQQRVTSKP